MTPDERMLLTRFLDDLGRARGVAKDREADGLIARALADNPDAAYLLVQHAIVADQSLHAAQARIGELERDAEARPAAGAPQPGFLPQPGPWGGGGAYAPPPPEARPGIFSGGGGLGSFLRSAGTTAAGVAGGEMLFSGLSDLFGGGRHEGFGGRPEEVIVNNYGDGGDRDGDDRGGDGLLSDGDFGGDDRDGGW